MNLQVEVAPTQALAADTRPSGRRPSVVRTVVRTFGELLITGGLVILLFAVYVLYGTGLTTARAQAQLEDQIAQTWSEPAPRPAVAQEAASEQPAPPPALGAPVAVLAVPKLGRDYRHVVVEGTGREELKKGPGHQPGTAMPGELGNFVLAGHRTTYGAPFGRFDELGVGDEVSVTSQSGSYTYRISQVEVVDPSDTAVMLPVPRQPGAAPTERLLTMITCTPKYSASQRLILTGVLTSADSRRGP